MCTDPDADVTRQQAGCDWRGASPRAARRFSVYRLYVERGNTPLIDLPPWVAEVARLAAHYEGMSRQQDYHDRQERERCKNLQRQYGMT